MTEQTYDFLIVGAGIVGLTIAQELKTRHPSASIVILEKEAEIGRHASGRNSGVMHSGVYYGSDTLKAKVCADGAARMQEFALRHKIPYKKSGKVIIATCEDDVKTIDRLLNNAKENGVRAERLDEHGVKQLEPHASPYKAGIYSPDTAVIDSKAVVIKLRELLEAKDVSIIFNAEFINIDIKRSIVHTSQGAYHFAYCFNCAGAYADTVAKKFGMASDYALVPFKGIYYKLKQEKAYLVNSNIYPVPDINLPFLGVHLTRVISGDVYVGPTAIPAFGRENYGLLEGIELKEGSTIITELTKMYVKNKQNFRLLVHNEIQKYLKPYFVKSAQRLMQEIKAEDLEATNKVGIRPQLINIKKGTLELDYILEKTDKSLHVLNSISPAFTSSLAFAEWIVNQSET